MQSLREFIIKSDFDFGETFTTESGVELYASKRFTGDKLSNKIVSIISCPAMLSEDILEPGFEVVIDPTVYFQQHYNTTGDQDGPMVINRRKGLYRLNPSMIILYRKDKDSEWVGYGNSLLIEKKTEVTEEKIEGIITGINKKNEQYFVAYPNSNETLEAGEEVFVNTKLAIPLWFDNKEYLWLNNSDILAKVA